MVAPPLVTNLAQLAVPEALALGSAVIAAAVATPATAAVNAGFPSVGDASNVCVLIATSALAGCGAVYILTVPPFSNAATASAEALAPAALTVIADVELSLYGRLEINVAVPDVAPPGIA